MTNKSKFRQDKEQARPSERLRYEEEAPKQAAKEARRLKKSKFRVEKTGVKLDAACQKLAKQKPRKPPGALKTMSRAAVYGVWAKVHGKIHEVERDNVGVEAAHHTELMAEHAVRSAIHHTNRRFRTRPARQVAKWERKHIKASADYRFRQLAQEHPELNRHVFKRHLQKQRLKKQNRKQAQEAAKKTAKKTGENVLSATEKIGRAAVLFVKRNPTGVLIALLIFLLVVILQSCVGGALTVGSDLLGAIGGTSYLSEDEDIDEAELRYTEWLRT